MSDSQPSPDWWLASDGKWYPPTSSPGWGRASDPPSRSLSVWLQVSLWATGVLGALVALTGLAAHDAARTWETAGGDTALQDWVDANEATTTGLGVLSLAVLVVLVLAIVWMNTAHKWEAAFQPVGRRWSSGWTVGAWFVPIGNWLLPKLVLDEIERVAAAPADDDDGVIGERWRQVRPSAVGWVFWIGWVAGQVATGVGSVISERAIDTSAVDEIDVSAVLASYTWIAVGGAGLAVAGVFGALHFRRLSHMVSYTP